MANEMRIWQLDSPGPVATNIHLVENAPRPPTTLEKGQILVEVASMGLNPADYKVPEMGLLAKAAVKFPKTPGMDFSGRVVSVGEGVSSLKPGDLALGQLDPTKAAGALSQFIVTTSDRCVSFPAGGKINFDQAAGASTTGLTMLQTIVPNVKQGDKIFINGGSGGLGTLGIQIAKTVGCHVTVSCSTDKAAQCKALGADEIIDYKTSTVISKLKEAGQVFSLVIDNVGSSPQGLYEAANDFLLPTGKFIYVGGSMTSASMKNLARAMFLPRFLGGGKRKFETFVTKSTEKDLKQIVEWMEQGKIKTVIDSVFEFEDVAKAIEKLKQGSSVGKIIVHVAGKSS